VRTCDERFKDHGVSWTAVPRGQTGRAAERSSLKRPALQTCPRRPLIFADGASPTFAPSEASSCR
jgi:hypothetical protein